MDWMEVTIATSPAGMEPLAARLTALGYDSFIMDDQQEFHEFLEANRQYWDYVDEDLERAMAGRSQIRLYLEDSPAGRQAAAELARQVATLRSAWPSVDLGPLTVATAPVRSEDWENGWKRYYQPLAIGRRLLVVPQWLEAENPEGRIPVRLDPGMSFGTGAHASTQMCMTALERVLRGGERVADLGSGSGILSITALLLGAREAVAVDVDPMAEDIARENAALNGLGPDRFTAVTGNVLEDRELLARLGRPDVVLANIVADVIIPLAPMVPGLLREGGTFLCSGILETRLPEVEAAVEAAGLTITERNRLEDWCQLTAVR